MRRALTEAAQTRLNYISGSRDDLMAAEYVTKGMAEKNAAFEQFVTASSIERSFSDVPTRTHPTLRGDLDDLLAALNAVGIDEVAVVDLTRESVGISVARVIIPGLEAPHDDNAYIPGPRAQEPAI
jgi:ribosomal protein S12 methylthiotransferase accessory factor